MKKILVVDDDLDILTLMQMSLSMSGFEVETTARWQVIDERIAKFSPDLILLDVSLGGADGREICKRLKTTKDTEHIPIVLFSANIEIEKSIHDCHSQAFIAKPFSLTHLVEIIRKNMGSSNMN